MNAKLIWTLVPSIPWLIFLAYWIISALRTRSQAVRKRSPTSLWLYWVLLGLGFVILSIDPVSSWRFLPDNLAMKLIGYVILVIGLSFATWARIHLGKYWSERITIKVDHKLIRSGPYNIVRHPMYTGILFGFIGSVIMSGGISALVALALVLTALLVKIGQEEKLLLEEFGPTYVQYKKKVKTLIPFIA